jgi:DnaT-like ssDNA binding protein
MALIVEDGTGKADAESYCTVAEATAHLTARGLGADWEAVDDRREACLRKATEYITQLYRPRWKGQRLTEAQALDWPRSGVRRIDFDGYYAENAVPAEVKKACAELALKADAADLFADVGRLASRERVEGAVDVSYFENQASQVRYEAAERTLRPLLSSGGGGGSTIPVSRS